MFSGVRKKKSMQALHRFRCPVLFHQKADGSIRGSLAYDADIHIGNGGKNPTRHPGLTPDVLTHKADERLVILPSHARQVLQLGGHGGQSGG